VWAREIRPQTSFGPADEIDRASASSFTQTAAQAGFTRHTTPKEMAISATFRKRPGLGRHLLCMAATVWKGYLSFGLVSFPVRLFAAARPEAVHFHLLHKTDLSRVKEVWYCAEEDKPISRSDIVKGYEYSKDKYVVVSDEDLSKVAPPTATTMEIQQFVQAAEVDPIFFEKSYYMLPEEKIGKPYFLLLTAMKQTGYYAVAKVTMHGREHVVIIRPGQTENGKSGMILHTMYFVDELNSANAAMENAEKHEAKPAAKEMELAKRLIDSLASPFKPEQYHDQYRENVERMLEQKQNGRRIAAVKQPANRSVVNIMDALQRSLRESSKRAPRATKSAVPKSTPKKRARTAA
jgi:DNA end-binding protein Ku